MLDGTFTVFVSKASMLNASFFPVILVLSVMIILTLLQGNIPLLRAYVNRSTQSSRHILFPDVVVKVLDWFF